MSYFPPTGSTVAFQSNPANFQASIRGAVSVAGGSLSVANFPATQNVSGSVASFVQGTPNVNTTGSVVAFQGTVPWTIGSIYGNISGSVAATITNTNVNVSGSVAALITGGVSSVTQVGTWFVSVLGQFAEDGGHTNADRGFFMLGVRNDAVASFAGTNIDYTPIATTSAGQPITKPFAAEEARIEGYNSVVSTSVTTLVAAAGAGLRNYITDIVLANTGATTTLVTFRSGGGTSILGYGIAPAGGGSNMMGFATPIRTLANETFDFQATSASSILFATVKGFKAP